MNSFQRMIAIPQEEYLALSSMQNVKEPLAQHFYNLENRYEMEGKEKDPYRRLMLQSNTLDQMKQVKEQIRDSLVLATPKPYQSRANALFQFVASFLKFNDKGEIYSNDGDVLHGSRLEDLIQHAVRDRRRNIIPTGWSDFVSMLRDHNVPKSMLNRNTLDEMDETVLPLPLLKRKVKTPPSFRPSRISLIDRKRKRDIFPLASSDIKSEVTDTKTKSRLQPARAKKPEPSDFRKIQFLKKFKNG